MVMTIIKETNKNHIPYIEVAIKNPHLESWSPAKRTNQSGMECTKVN